MTRRPLNNQNHTTGLLAQVRRLRSLQAIREWLHLSLADVGREAARLTGRESHYDRSTVLVWEKKNECDLDVLRAYGTLIANRAELLLGTDNFGIFIKDDSPLQFCVMRQCASCRTWFELLRSNTRLCEKCRAAKKR